MIVLKKGVRLHGIRPELTIAVMIAERLWDDAGETLIITSVIDGTHMRASIHYTGGAVNFRVSESKAVVLRNRLAEALGEDFDVVVEPGHVHVEWQPKKPY